MELAKREDCTGCGACIKICPRQAVSYRNDFEGFPTPFIDHEKCVECGRCEKVCPALHPAKTNSIRAAYAAQLLDKETLKISTSGGLFSAFAEEILRRGGVVFGCRWTDRYDAVVVSARNKDELMPMHGSKYVWSSAASSFPKVRAALEEGKEVLFTGLPCQGAGLKNYLGKDYPNLYVMVFFCGGTPSPYVFKEYLKTLTKKVPLDKLDFRFRDKEKYGVGVHITYQGEKGRVQETYLQNSYFFAYHTKVFHRPCCYHCQYRYEGRLEDLTMGDYWDISKFHNEFNIPAGVSSLLVNSEKGEQLLEAVRDRLQMSPTRLENIAYYNNLTLGNVKRTFNPPPYRKEIFETLRKKGWKAAERRYLYNSVRLKLEIRRRVPVKYIDMAKKLLRR